MNTGRRGICWFCGAELMWCADHNLEDLDDGEKGVVAELECPSCGAEATFVQREKE